MFLHSPSYPRDVSSIYPPPQAGTTITHPDLDHTQDPDIHQKALYSQVSQIWFRPLPWLILPPPSTINPTSLFLPPSLDYLSLPPTRFSLPKQPQLSRTHKPIDPPPPSNFPRTPTSTPAAPPPPPLPSQSHFPITLYQSAWAGPAAAAPAAASAPPRTFANPVGIFAAEGVGSGGGTGAGANKKDCRHRLSDYDEECDDGIWSMGMRFWEGYHRRNHACC